MTTTARIHAAQVSIDAHRDAIKDFDVTATDAQVIDLLASLRQLCESEDVDFSECVRGSKLHHQRLTSA